jgi:hypothetical protein
MGTLKGDGTISQAIEVSGDWQVLTEAIESITVDVGG